MHYFFDNVSNLEIFLQNVSSVLKPRGRFIGTCLNGSRVFEELRDSPIIEDTQNNCWKITRKYTKKEFNPNESSLGYEIEVYNESIGETFSEYLVNFDYFISVCSKYSLRLVESVDFRDVFEEGSNVKYGDMKSMSPQLQRYSFLNTYFVFEKVE